MKLLIDLCAEVGDCLIWKGATTSTGHPSCNHVWHGHHNPRAVFWERDGRSLKNKHVFIKPSCDDLCVKPEHQSYVPRSKVRRPSGALFAASARKAARSRSKLTTETVMEMRQRAAAGETQTALAQEYGLSVAQAHNIIRNKQWREVSPWAV